MLTNINYYTYFFILVNENHYHLQVYFFRTCLHYCIALTRHKQAHNMKLRIFFTLTLFSTCDIMSAYW